MTGIVARVYIADLHVLGYQYIFVDQPAQDALERAGHDSDLLFAIDVCSASGSRISAISCLHPRARQFQRDQLESHQRVRVRRGADRLQVDRNRLVQNLSSRGGRGCDCGGSRSQRGSSFRRGIRAQVRCEALVDLARGRSLLCQSGVNHNR